MKLTKTRLKQIIREELLKEGGSSSPNRDFPYIVDIYSGLHTFLKLNKKSFKDKHIEKEIDRMLNILLPLFNYMEANHLNGE